MFGLPSALGLMPGRVLPVGEDLLTASSGSWVCPADVTSIAVVLIGRGGNGIQFGGTASGGGGGALAYKNSIAVTPGQSYSYSITTSSTTMFGITAGAGQIGGSNRAATGGTATGGDANFSGGNSTARSGGSSKAGGSAASYTADGASNGGVGVGLTGTGSSGTYGRGGTTVFSGSPTNGGPGAIRIIWGEGRSYPDNAS